MSKSSKRINYLRISGKEGNFFSSVLTKNNRRLVLVLPTSREKARIFLMNCSSQTRSENLTHFLNPRNPPSNPISQRKRPVLREERIEAESSYHEPRGVQAKESHDLVEQSEYQRMKIAPDPPLPLPCQMPIPNTGIRIKLYRIE